MDDIHIRCLDTLGDREIHGLSDVLIDCVEGGASVSFLLPMTRAKAEAFWRRTAASVTRNECVVLTAEEADGTIVGTVTVLWAQPENQPHRGELAKMLVHRRVRRRGVGAALLAAAEQRALNMGKTLLVLDTVTESDGYRLYTRHGWQRCGDIPSMRCGPMAVPVRPRSFSSACVPDPTAQSFIGFVVIDPDVSTSCAVSSESGEFTRMVTCRSVTPQRRRSSKERDKATAPALLVLLFLHRDKFTQSDLFLRVNRTTT